VGLRESEVRLLGETQSWLRYRIPDNLIRKGQEPRCIGQKQKWYLLELCGDPDSISLDRGEKREFDEWQWVSYWYPVGQVVSFKRPVYRRAMLELAPTYQRLIGS
jgi:putative (di)nucleoside polyphosphate hydrolase